MIEVFRTNITEEEVAESIGRILKWHFPDITFNFDLEDCDRILRVEIIEELVCPNEIEEMVKAAGYHCEVLEDTIEN